MTRLAFLFPALLLAACASAPVPPSPVHLFHDELFSAPPPHIQTDEVFALSDSMKHYVAFDIASQLHGRGLQKGLLDALYSKQQLKLEYDAERTRNAAEAFDARAGNCLSLVIMTAAFAKHLGLQVSYQSVYTDETWTRNHDTYFASGHVNLTLGRRKTDPSLHADPSSWTIDFLPPEDQHGQRSREISEATIVAMYMNNRAVETLAGGDREAAYWWARAAMIHAPDFLSAYNTLGVIYLRHGQAAAAEQVLAQVLERDPANTVAMANRVRVLAMLGRAAESATLAAQLARLDPEPPFHFYDLGREALRAGDYATARDWFAKEVRRAPYQHEFHFWLAVAELRLGDLDEARKHLSLAMQNSTTATNRQLYAAKLDHLKHLGMQ